MNLNLLDPKLIVLAAVVILIIAVLAWLYVRKRKSTTADLRQRFGPEYERAVREHGSERKAEAKLADREKRVEKLKIIEIFRVTERDTCEEEWRSRKERKPMTPELFVAAEGAAQCLSISRRHLLALARAGIAGA